MSDLIDFLAPLIKRISELCSSESHIRYEKDGDIKAREAITIARIGIKSFTSEERNELNRLIHELEEAKHHLMKPDVWTSRVFMEDRSVIFPDEFYQDDKIIYQPRLLKEIDVYIEGLVLLKQKEPPVVNTDASSQLLSLDYLSRFSGKEYTNASDKLVQTLAFLKKHMYVSPDTKPRDFERVFSRVETDKIKKVCWTGGAKSRASGSSTLVYFIKRIYEKQLIINTGRIDWQKIVAVFCDKEGRAFSPDSIKKREPPSIEDQRLLREAVDILIP